MYNVHTDFNMDMYTTPVDMAAADITEEQVQAIMKKMGEASDAVGMRVLYHFDFGSSLLRSSINHISSSSSSMNW